MHTETMLTFDLEVEIYILKEKETSSGEGANNN